MLNIFSPGAAIYGASLFKVTRTETIMSGFPKCHISLLQYTSRVIVTHLSILMAILPGKPGLAVFIGGKDNRSGGDNWSYKACKTPIKLSPPTNQHPTFYRPGALPVAQPTV